MLLNVILLRVSLHLILLNFFNIQRARLPALSENSLPVETCRSEFQDLSGHHFYFPPCFLSPHGCFLRVFLASQPSLQFSGFFWSSLTLPVTHLMKSLPRGLFHTGCRPPLTIPLPLQPVCSWSAFMCPQRGLCPLIF